MKLRYYFLFFMVAVLASCSSKPKNKVEATDSQEVAQAQGIQLKVDSVVSQIFWTGFKPAGSHHGTLGIKSGEIFVEGNHLKSGTFVLDMNNIICIDLKDHDAMQKKLVNHLKSPDFFDVAKYPEGKFSITNVEELFQTPDSIKVNISGNLELKGVSKNITFKATLTKDDILYKAQSEPFAINRTDWGVNYGSKNIFKDLKDAYINDEIEVILSIVAIQQ